MIANGRPVVLSAALQGYIAHFSCCYRCTLFSADKLHLSSATAAVTAQTLPGAVAVACVPSAVLARSRADLQQHKYGTWKRVSELQVRMLLHNRMYHICWVVLLDLLPCICCGTLGHSNCRCLLTHQAKRNQDSFKL
jgi:hypothetical protein